MNVVTHGQPRATSGLGGFGMHEFNRDSSHVFSL